MERRRRLPGVWREVVLAAANGLLGAAAVGGGAVTVAPNAWAMGDALDVCICSVSGAFTRGIPIGQKEAMTECLWRAGKAMSAEEKAELSNRPPLLYPLWLSSRGMEETGIYGTPEQHAHAIHGAMHHL